MGYGMASRKFDLKSGPMMTYFTTLLTDMIKQ